MHQTTDPYYRQIADWETHVPDTDAFVVPRALFDEVEPGYDPYGVRLPIAISSQNHWQARMYIGQARHVAQTIFGFAKPKGRIRRAWDWVLAVMGRRSQHV